MVGMEPTDIDDTLPIPTGSEETIPPPSAEGEADEQAGETTALTQQMSAVQEPPPPTARPRAWLWLFLLALLLLLAIASISAYSGYRAGIEQRTSFESTQIAQEAQRQFELGVQDMEAGRYETARQRFEYVIQLDPAYPGVTDRLAEVLLELNTTATPTPVPTPTLTPTPDLRNAEELFSQAQVLLAEKNWDAAIETLLKLRKDEPTYQAVKVDSMLYVALRNRGVDKILNQADLEGGTYDLALAERFGPLDVEASNYRTWADLYLTGASFWMLDWAQASYYFSQLVLVAPNLRDNSNMTATERFRIATLNYADALAKSGEWCLAMEQYQALLALGADQSIESSLARVTSKCMGETTPEEQPTSAPPTSAPPPEYTPTPEGYPPANP
jgi:tetratricopeptide (TPR) repeat protein